MIIKCKKIISPTTKEDLGKSSTWLTVGKEYVVLALQWDRKFGILAMIQADCYNEPVFIPLEGFEIISQKIPGSWKGEIDEYGTFEVMPKSWLYDEFLQELEDQTQNTMKLFEEESRIIYEEEGLI